MLSHAARREERAEWMQQFKPELITQKYVELVREVINETDTRLAVTVAR